VPNIFGVIFRRLFNISAAKILFRFSAFLRRYCVIKRVFIPGTNLGFGRALKWRRLTSNFLAMISFLKIGEIRLWMASVQLPAASQSSPLLIVGITGME
jgi:hypothetical protein